MDNMRTFTFLMTGKFDSDTEADLLESVGVISVANDKAPAPGIRGTNVTIQFDPAYLMEVADDLGALGFSEAEQNIFEEHYDLLED